MFLLVMAEAASPQPVSTQPGATPTPSPSVPLPAGSVLPWDQALLVAVILLAFFAVVVDAGIDWIVRSRLRWYRAGEKTV